MSDYAYKDEVRPDVWRMVPPDGRVIGSVGCGTAALEGRLVAAGREVHGVDVSAEAIAVAAGRITTARVVAPDDWSPFPDESLDGLILADVLEHIPRAWEALARFARAVRPGGWVVLSVPNMRNAEVLLRFAAGGDVPEHRTGIYDATHVQVMSKRRLARWCRAAGLRVERWFDCYDPNGPRRGRFFRLCDLLTARLLHDWFMYEVQGVWRKDPPPAGPRRPASPTPGGNP